MIWDSGKDRKNRLNWTDKKIVKENIVRETSEDEYERQ